MIKNYAVLYVATRLHMKYLSINSLFETYIFLMSKTLTCNMFR